MAQRIIRPATLTTAALLIATAGLTACGSSSSNSSPASTPANTPTKTVAAATPTPVAGGGTSVPVTLSEYKIKPAVASAPAGHVVFDVTNSGQIKHQFTIICNDEVGRDRPVQAEPGR